MVKEKKEAAAEQEAVVQVTKQSVELQNRIDELNRLRITAETPLPPIRAVLSIDNIPIFELGDLGAVKAKQKAGKTTLLKTMCAAWMKGQQFRLKSELNEAKVILFDTEQKLPDVKKIIEDIKQMTGLGDEYINRHLRVYSVRTLSYKTLLTDTERIISVYQPHVVIIDGVVDYIQSFNDETLSHQLVNELIRMSDVYNCAIISVLHENKGADDHNMRGHLGTMLAQKSGTVLQCKKDGEGVITVTCSDSRHQSIPDFKIRYDQYGHIVSADDYDGRMAAETERRLEIVREFIAEKGGSSTRKELTDKLIAELGLSRTTVANMITRMLGNSLCEVNGMIQMSPEPDLPFV